MTLRKIGDVLLLTAAVGSLTGCRSGDTGNSEVKVQPVSQADLDKQIKAVEDNPNLPASQKAAIIGRIRSQSAGGNQGRPGAK
jgi:hypothetical protein